MKTVFITGGTRGIGRETALTYARNGWRVFTCGRNQALIEELNTLARKENLALECFKADVTIESDVLNARDRVLEVTSGQGVDVLINNAGYQELGPVEDLPAPVWRRQFETNLFGMITVVQAFLPAMRAQKRGRIINLSSMAGRVAFATYGPYCASKHAIEGMSDALRLELKQFGIKVVIIEPGPMISNINITAYENLAKNRPAETAYTPYYDRGPAALDAIEKKSFPTKMAADVIWKAGTVSRPRRRYRVTYLASLAIFARNYLPGWMYDFFMRRSV